MRNEPVKEEKKEVKVEAKPQILKEEQSISTVSSFFLPRCLRRKELRSEAAKMM